jgi:hypothetical protein
MNLCRYHLSLSLLAISALFWPVIPQAPAGEPSAHWSFQPLTRQPLPATRNPQSEIRNSIDLFVDAQLEQQHISPVAAADRRTLVRRLHFDLLGLPPSPEEVAAFVNDPSPDALERLVDRLLASPHYGERWGRHWMDVVRYADTAGDNADYPVPEARHYRDYIIAAFNADKPFDEFIQEQVAGDLLAASGPPEQAAERTIATGFLALSRRYATAPYELWHLSLEDSVDTVGRAFLGLTLKCARCHDHKFDPVTTEDYYALYGIFASTQFPWAGAEEFASKGFNRQHFASLLSPEETMARQEAQARRLVEIKARIHWLENEDKTPEVKPEIDRLRAELRNLQRTNLPADVPVAYAVRDGQAADTPVQEAGDPGQPGQVARRGAPAFLPGGGPLEIPAGASGRLQLARWLTRGDNPLTARVLANRIWQHHFGSGIVGTSSNFGTSGEAPTHPELLDYLAAELRDGGWSVKSLHRLILASAAYQRSSADDDVALAADPDNRLYWRMSRRRLDAETIRDALLSTGERLDLRRPAQHPFPHINTWGWTQHTPFKDVYSSQHRSVYLMTQRIQKHPFLALFDGPDTNTTTDSRTSSIVPLQALYFLNSPQMQSEAAALAERLIASSPETRLRLQLAYELCYSRPPTAGEIDGSENYLAAYADRLSATGQTPAAIERAAWLSLARVLLSANEFLYID